MKNCLNTDKNQKVLNGRKGEFPLLSNVSVALKSSGETYRYLPVLLE